MHILETVLVLLSLTIAKLLHIHNNRDGIIITNDQDIHVHVHNLCKHATGKYITVYVEGYCSKLTH